MNLAKTLALLSVPLYAQGACTVDFPRPGSNQSTPVANPWPPVALNNLPAWVEDLDSSIYGLWGVIFGSVLQCQDALNISDLATLAADDSSTAFACIFDSSPSCPSYRYTNADCTAVPFPLPGEYCFRIPECSDLYTTMSDLGAISLNWKGGASDGTRALNVHQGYGCTGPVLIPGSATLPGTCQKFPNQQFYLKAWNHGSREYELYAKNWLQIALNNNVCGAYNQTCLGGPTGTQEANFAARVECAAENANGCPDWASSPNFPACGSSSGSSSGSSDASSSASSSASSLVASLALVVAGAFLF